MHPHAPVIDGPDCTLCPLPLRHPIHRADVLAALDGAPLPPVDRPTARVGLHAPDTSRAAAGAALPASGTVKAAVYDVIASRPQGATDDEVEVVLDRTHQSVSAARNALARDGWVVPLVGDDGHHVTRRTRTGHDAHAWVPSAAAHAQRTRGAHTA